MKKQPKHYTPEETVAILRRHLVEGVPISTVAARAGNVNGSKQAETNKEKATGSLVSI
jgi:hypothetical protein